MIVKIALNMEGKTPREQLTRVQTAVTQMTGNAVYPTPSPTLVVVQGQHDAALAKLDEIDAMETELDTLRLQRDGLMEEALGGYSGLASHVENKCLGVAANVTSAGFDLVGPRSATPAMEKVENNVLTTGDDAGTLDGSCDSQKGARSFEWQISPNGTDGFVHVKTTTTSYTHFTGLPSGTNQWSRVRAINRLGEGPWSDPAKAMVP